MSNLKKLGQEFCYLATKQLKYELFRYSISCSSLAPNIIHLILTNRCNLKCKMCFYPGMPHEDELTLEELAELFKEFDELFDYYGISLTGGEPTVRKDFPQILDLLPVKPKITLTTNGFKVDKKLAIKLCDKQIVNYSTSLDGLTETHNYLRGSSRAYDYCINGLTNMLEAVKETGYHPDITVTTVVNSKNYKELIDIIKVINSLDDNISIYFQSLTPHGKFAVPGSSFWLSKTQAKEFEEISEQIIAMKKAGYSISNTVNNLKTMAYATINNVSQNKCDYPLRTIQIEANGDLKYCYAHPAIGNIRERSFKELWSEPQNIKERRLQSWCRKECYNTCKIKPALLERLMDPLTIKRAIHFLR